MPMYEVVETNSLAHFKSKVDLSQNYKNYIDCLGNFHKILSFKISEDSAIDLSYANKIGGDTFKININFVRLNFNLIIESTNRYYCEHLRHFAGKEKPDDNILKKDIQAIGISIGDLIKHFYHNNKEKEIQFSEDKQENDQMNKLLKKALSVDTATTSIYNVLGTYQYHRKTVYLWETLDKYIEKGKNDFDGFCNKILYMSGKIIPDLIVKDIKTKKYSLDDKKCTNLFNSLTDKMIIYKLLRYHLYNEDPEQGFQTKIHYFENPITVPEILKYFYEKYNDNEYLELYNKVVKKLNGNQQQELNEKYKPAIFASIKKVADEYPIFAFRNISLKQWGPGDLRELDRHYIDYMRFVKNQKLKHKSSISNKVIPVEQRIFHESWGREFHTGTEGKHKKNREQLKMHIKEALKDY